MTTYLSEDTEALEYEILTRQLDWTVGELAKWRYEEYAVMLEQIFGPFRLVPQRIKIGILSTIAVSGNEKGVRKV